MGKIMMSKETQFDQVKNEISDLNKTQKYQREKTTDATIDAMKRELISIEGPKPIGEINDGSEHRKKNSHLIIIVVILVIILLIVLLAPYLLLG